MPRTPPVPPTRAPITGGPHKDGWRETHPAYATLQVSHVQGHSGPMFGSTLPDQPGYIAMRLHTAGRTHDLGRDWIHGDIEVIAEWHMTHAQFVEMVATPNQGTGTPVTLDYIRDGKIIEVPGIKALEDITEAAEALRTMQARARSLAGLVTQRRQRIRAILDSRVSKKLADEIDKELAGLETELGSNVPFYVQQVIEAGEKVVSGVRVEAESIVSGIARRLGFERLEDIAAATRRIEEKP